MRRSIFLFLAAVALGGVAALPAGGAETVANGRIAFVATDTGTTQVYTVNPDGSGLTKVTNRPHGAGEYGVTWSADATRLLVVLSTNHDLIYAMRPDGGGLRRLSPSCTGQCLGDDLPAVSRSGKRIAFERAFGPVVNDTAAVCAIFTMAADGTHVRQLTQRTRPNPRARPNPTEDHSATWSPDGHRIAFQRLNTTASPVGRSAIYVMNADGTHIRRVTPRAMDASNPRWSPDGTRILFNDVAEPVAGKDANIYTVHPDGSSLTRITSYTGGSAQAFVDDWSPDGTKIVFHFLDNAVNDLYVMNADGSSPRPITRLGADANPRHAMWGAAP